MRLIFCSLTVYILTTNTFFQDVNTLKNDASNLFLSNDDTSYGLNINPDLENDELWSSSDVTNFIDADTTGLFFDVDNEINDDLIASCIFPGNSDTLNRRGGELTCPNPLKPPANNDDVKEENPPDVKFRRLGTTEDLPLATPTYNMEICDPLTMGTYRTIVACDSGREEDRKPTEDPGIYVLEHCTPCKLCAIPISPFPPPLKWKNRKAIRKNCSIFVINKNQMKKKASLIIHIVDILRGCHYPHEIWCCHDLTPEVDSDEIVSFILRTA